MVDGWGWLASADRQNSTAAEYAARGGGGGTVIHINTLPECTVLLHVQV